MQNHGRFGVKSFFHIQERRIIMSFTYLNQLPSPEEIKKRYPLPANLAALKKERDKMISDVICGKDDRFLVIIGPCSADNEDSVPRARATKESLHSRTRKKHLIW